MQAYNNPYQPEWVGVALTCRNACLSGVPGAYDNKGSFTTAGTLAIPARTAAATCSCFPLPACFCCGCCHRWIVDKRVAVAPADIFGAAALRLHTVQDNHAFKEEYCNPIRCKRCVLGGRYRRYGVGAREGAKTESTRSSINKDERICVSVSVKVCGQAGEGKGAWGWGVGAS